MGLAWDHEKMSKHKPPWTVLVTLGGPPMSSSQGPWAADFADGRLLGRGIQGGRNPGF